MYLRLKLVLRVCPTQGGESQICRDPLVASSEQQTQHNKVINKCQAEWRDRHKIDHVKRLKTYTLVTPAPFQDPSEPMTSLLLPQD